MTRNLLTAAADARGARWIGLALVTMVGLTAALADAVAPGDPFATSPAVLQPPSWPHPFGTDDFGRDMLRAIVHGTQVSLIVAVAATVMAVTLGVVIGAAAGYAGGLVDDGLMRFTEIFQVVPRFFLVVAVVALFGSSIGLLILIIALTSWSGTARLARGQVLTLATFDHVVAARAAGAGPLRVLTRHVLPLALPPLVAHSAFQASGAILAEAGVSFLGLGDPSVMTWGALLHEAHHFLRTAWWLAVFPGLALTVTVLGFHLLADGLADPNSD